MICRLPVVPGILLGQPDRLDDLADLALVAAAFEGALREEPGAHELLGDRGCAAAVAAGGVDRRRDDADRVEAGVLQNVLSSTAVVASTSHGGSWSKCRRPRDWSGRSGPARPCRSDRRRSSARSKSRLSSRSRRVGQALAVDSRSAADRGDEPDEAEQEEGPKRNNGKRDGDLWRPRHAVGRPPFRRWRWRRARLVFMRSGTIA